MECIVSTVLTNGLHHVSPKLILQLTSSTFISAEAYSKWGFFLGLLIRISLGNYRSELTDSTVVNKEMDIVLTVMERKVYKPTRYHNYVIAGSEGQTKWVG